VKLIVNEEPEPTMSAERFASMSQHSEWRQIVPLFLMLTAQSSDEKSDQQNSPACHK
jgi:hypothetical protein